MNTDEFTFINTIKQPTYRQSSLQKGIGDDAAVFRSPNEDIVTAMDTMVENVHFSRETMSPWHIGYRSLAINLSDLAAMGARPAFYLVSITVPSDWHDDQIEDIFKGMRAMGDCYQMDLIGGDTVSGNDLSISVTVIGYVATGCARYRHSAVVGDVVFVTGTLGDAQAGLHILTHPGHYQDHDYFVNRHRMPRPRVTFARHLKPISRLVLNDISDGIASEANEIAEASDVTLILDDEALPVSAQYNQFTSRQCQNWKLFAGEDFELLGTVAYKDWPAVEQAAAKSNTSVTKIGIVTDKQQAHVYLQKDHQHYRLGKQGYNHFKQVNANESHSN